MSDVIDFGELRRRKEPPPYVDRARIAAALAEIDAATDQIIRDSYEQFGAIDTLAYELNALTLAISRAVGLDEKEG